jgi:tetratricopeptide (TPR) repeat protein/transcriptional regulator with XRE-family HTH domain
MPEGAPITFAALLRQYRLAAGLTQAQLAEGAGLSSRGISDLERGARRLPRRDTLALLTTALGLSARERAHFEAAAHALAGAGTAEPRRFPRGRPSRQARLAALAALARATTGSPALPLVGRIPELRLLEQHLAGEGPPLLLLAGEPGIGKTRLLQEADGRAARMGWTVLSGGCSRGGGQQPFAPVLEALERHIYAQMPPRLRADLRGCAWLVRLLPELAEGPIEPLPTWTLPPEQERRLFFGAVRRYLANVAGPAGTLLLLDDLQWAGADALALLDALVRAAPTLRLRLVGAYRDTEMQSADPLASWLADLAQAALVRQHTVGSLGADAADLLDLLLEGVQAERPVEREQVLQRAGGVPFFLHSYAQALRQGGVPTVPWDLAQGVRQRVAALPAMAQEVVRHAAVVGRVAERSVLLAMAGQARAVVPDALDAACRVRLLEEAGPDAYRFTHDVVREVVEGDLGAAQCTALHQRVGEALEALPGIPPVQALAYHYARCDATEKAILYLEQAGDEAWAQHANADAADYYEQVAARLDRLGRTPDAARGRAKLGEVLAMMARYASALEALEQAADALLVAGDLERAGRVAGRIAGIHGTRGTPAEGIAYLQPLLTRLERQGPSGALAILYTVLAELHLNTGQYADELEAAERAVEAARLAGDDRIRVRADNMRGWTLRLAGRDGEALETLRVVAQVAETLGDEECLSDALNLVAVIYEEQGDFDEARRYTRRGLLAAEHLGDPARIADLTVRQGVTAFYAGEWERASQCYDQAHNIHRRAGIPPGSCSYAGLLFELGRLHLALGEWEVASRFLEESRAIYAPQGSRAGLRIAESALAERDLLEGNPKAAFARLLPLLDRPDEEEHYVTTSVLPMLAWAYLDLGDTAQAAGLVADATRRLRSRRHLPALVGALRVQARLEIRRAQWDDAARTLEEGLALARSMPNPYGEARLLHVYGQLHDRKHDVAAARDRLDAALTIFRRLGARKDIERAEQDLAAVSSLPDPPDARATPPAAPISHSGRT